MRFNLVFSLLGGTLVYILVVLVNLFLRKPLFVVLRNGLTAMLLAAALCWFLAVLIKYFSNKVEQDQEEEQIESKSADNSVEKNLNQEQGAKAETNDSNEEFSPMDPTVLEVEEEETP